MKYSVVVPVYRNAEFVPQLLACLSAMNTELGGGLEAVFVVDGSPDNSYELLAKGIVGVDYPVRLLAHSRNFGSFAAIRTGLAAARGQYFAVMAADLQEPPELVVTFFRSLAADECDVAIGTREARDDPYFSRLASHVFWEIYRRTIVRDMPSGGVDVFACNRQFRDELLKLEESRSSLIALIFWLGFRRKFFSYSRRPRQFGKSAWTFSKKVEYLADSIFSFTNYPIRLMIGLGAFGAFASFLLAGVVVLWRLLGLIEVPGYAATMITVLFLGALNLLGLGVVGTYAWRAYENSKRRPLSIVARDIDNAGALPRMAGRDISR